LGKRLACVNAATLAVSLLYKESVSKKPKKTRKNVNELPLQQSSSPPAVFADDKRALFRLFLSEVPPEQPVANLKPGDVMNYIVKQSKERSGYSANKDRPGTG
jgi:hypothetical protein